MPRNKAISGIILFRIFKDSSLTIVELTDYVNYALENRKLMENAKINFVER